MPNYKYTSPPPAPPLPPPTSMHFRQASWNSNEVKHPMNEPECKPKADYYFNENSLKVTREDLEQEIPAGSAQTKIGAFTRFIEQQNDNNYQSRFSHLTPGKLQIKENFLQPQSGSLQHTSRANGFAPTSEHIINRVNGFQRHGSEPPSTQYAHQSDVRSQSNQPSYFSNTLNTMISSSDNLNTNRSITKEFNGYLQTATPNYSSNISNGTLPKANGTLRNGLHNKKVSFSVRIKKQKAIIEFF